MDFMIWMTRGLHLFAVIVWLGGLLFQAVIFAPGIRSGKLPASETVTLLFRFVPFIWMSVWTVVITGVALMLFDPRFIFFSFESKWSIILAIKETIFLLMVFFSIGYGRMMSRASEETEREGGSTPYVERAFQFNRINVGLGIVAIVLAAGLE